MLNMHSGIENMVFDYGVCRTVSFIMSGLETRSPGHSTLCITQSPSPSQSVQVSQGVNVSCSRPHRTGDPARSRTRDPLVRSREDNPCAPLMAATIGFRQANLSRRCFVVTRALFYYHLFIICCYFWYSLLDMLTIRYYII